MGLRLVVPLSTTEAVRTVSVEDLSIDWERSDQEAFLADRSDLGALSLAAAPPGAPWEGPSYFSLRPLADSETRIVAAESGAEARGLGVERGSAAHAALLFRRVFALACVGWENVWRAGGEGEGPAVQVEYAAVEAGGRRSVRPDLIEHIPVEATTDLGSLAWSMSTLTEREAGRSGSSSQGAQSSTPSPTSAGTNGAAGGNPTSEPSWDATATESPTSESPEVSATSSPASG